MTRLLPLLLAAALLVAAPPATAQSVSFQGKTVSLIYGGGTGGGFDTYAMLLAPFMTKHLPGRPLVLVKGVPGAGTLAAANYIYEVAPANGTEIGTASGNTATAALFKTPGIRFDPRRFTWLGSATAEVAVVLAWHTSGVKSIGDLKLRKLIVGGGGPTSGNVISPTLLNRLFGLQFEIVRGYRSSGEAMLAVERGELQGLGSWNYSSIRAAHYDLVRDGKIALLLQLALRKHPELGQVPLVTDLAQTEEQRAILELVFAPQSIGRPFFAPPATPPDIAATLRRAFDAVIADADFVKEADRLHLDVINPLGGPAVHALIDQLYAQPPDTVAKAIAATDTTELK